MLFIYQFQSIKILDFIFSFRYDYSDNVYFLKGSGINHMKYYLAPMEGITTYIYRNAYNHYFGGIDKYFTPFIASKKMNRREMNEILPEHNKGINVVPQILTNRTDEFLPELLQGRSQLTHDSSHWLVPALRSDSVLRRLPH